jgi:hypothetical protein
MLHANLILFALGIGAKQLWANEPAAEDNIIMTAYPVGNGKLGGKCFQLLPFIGLAVYTDTYEYVQHSLLEPLDRISWF